VCTLAHVNRYTRVSKAIILCAYVMPSLLSVCIAAFSSGLLAAVSPCVIVLVPLVLFRFLRRIQQHHDNNNYNSDGKGRRGASYHGNMAIQVVAFVAGFEVSYLILAYSIQGILLSSIQVGRFVVSSLVCYRYTWDAMFTPWNALTHTYTTHTYVHILSLTYMYSYIPTCIYIHMYSYIPTCIYIHMYSY